MGSVIQEALALAASGMTKRFGSTIALDAVDLHIPAGRIHALLGMNGSGKSTLVKLLSGFHTADEGVISVGGEPLRDGAIAFVHQDLGLIDELSVLENLSLGSRPPVRRGAVSRTAEREQARHSLAPFRLDHVVDRPLGSLTVAERTIVAIARAMRQAEHGCRLIVLDEPTSTLPASETNQLLDAMRGCAQRGMGVLFISHRLGEVMAVADDVTVLRSGRAVYRARVDDSSVEAIVAAMTGSEQQTFEALARTSARDVQARKAHDEEVVLEARGVVAGALAGLDLTVRRGEIVGVTGLLGCGIEVVGAVLAGRLQPRSGALLHNGQPVDGRARERIGFVTANRARQGVLGGLTARENASITTLGRYIRGGFISRFHERRAMSRSFEELAASLVDTETGMQQLSGGNQQKVLFARWLSTGMDLLVADEPTQGIDVHAKAHLLASLHDHAQRGLAVVLVSGEPEEIISACDRMVILADGRIVDEYVAPLSTPTILSAIHKGASRE